MSQAFKIVLALILIFTTEAAKAQEDKLWAKYSQGIVDEILGGNDEGLQLLSPFSVISLERDGLPLTEKQLRFLLNPWCESIPEVDVFYIEKPSATISGAYEAFLGSLKPPPAKSPEEEQRVQKAREAWLSTSQDLSASELENDQ